MEQPAGCRRCGEMMRYFPGRARRQFGSKKSNFKFEISKERQGSAAKADRICAAVSGGFKAALLEKNMGLTLQGGQSIGGRRSKLRRKEVFSDGQLRRKR